MKNHQQHLPDFPQAFTMIAVKGGQYDMGGESWSDSSLPIHPVKVDDFWIGQYPVTQALWTAVMGEGSNPSWFKGYNRPVESVSWNMAVEDSLPIHPVEVDDFWIGQYPVPQTCCFYLLIFVFIYF